MPTKTKRLGGQLSAGMARQTAPSTGSDGCDITPWNTLYGDRVPKEYNLRVGGSAAANITGATLWLYFADSATWEEVGLLGDNGDGLITITSSTQIHTEIVHRVGLAQRMAVVGTWSAGTPFASCEPLEEEDL